MEKQSIRVKSLNKNIKVGEYNTLLIDRDSSHGYYLISEDESDVLLPSVYVKDEMMIGNEVKVFVYRDSEDRLIATSEIPKLCVGEFAFLEVVDKTDFGVFVDIGLLKHVLVPKKMQKGNLKVGQSYLFALSLDIDSDRLVCDMRIHRYLDKEVSHAKHLKQVDLLVIAKTPLGFKVIVNNTFEGLVYENEIFSPLKVGDRLKGYVKKVRDDGKLDISINPMGKNKVDLNTQKVVEILKENKGFLLVNYKSDADIIKKYFGMSKKAFKASLTNLLNTNQIELKDGGIWLK